jgi:RNA polymerase sigma-70 factor (ECF subfamily)
MTSVSDSDTDHLLDRVGSGDAAVRQQLLARHRSRLRRMVALHLDRRLAARIDPSDVVQDVLVDADRRLDDYAQCRPLPFYPWLRQLAWDHLIEMHRRHLHARKRSVTREEPDVLHLPEESATELADRLVDLGSSPSARLLRSERCRRVRQALDELPERDREVLMLRHLEQLSTAEIAAVLGVREGTVKVRHLRALRRLRALLGEEEP